MMIIFGLMYKLRKIIDFGFLNGLVSYKFLEFMWFEYYVWIVYVFVDKNSYLIFLFNILN